MGTVAETLAEATARLREVTETPRLDAEILLAHACGVSRAQLLARMRETVLTSAREEFAPLLARRLAHEPIAYILGQWEFYSLNFITRAPILVPRPETEHLVEVALERLHGSGRLLDLCTGTGCVAVAVAKNAPGTTVLASDINPAAVALARENAARHGVEVSVFEGNLFEALPAGTPAFNVIVANPPYVPAGEWEGLPAVIRHHEDPRALLAGEDGLDFVREIVAGARQWLVQNGVVALEVGEGHFDAVQALMHAAGYLRVHFRRDLAGHKRIVFGEWEGT